MERKYLITQEQLELIEHYKKMFGLNAETVHQLCNSEKDDIAYGFELGKMHSHLQDCFMEMMELEDEIRKQQITNPTKPCTIHDVIERFSGENLMKQQESFVSLYGSDDMAQEKANSFAVGFGKACELICKDLQNGL